MSEVTYLHRFACYCSLALRVYDEAPAKREINDFLETEVAALVWELEKTFVRMTKG